MKTPLISVIMPVYNGEKYLRKSIECILNQTLKDFEFIIINDGSTDKSEQIIKSYKDQRIIYRKNSKNLNLVKTLNKALKIAKGKYIARMDADDISLPQRFEKETAFLDQNPEYGVVGCYFAVINDEEVPFEIGGVKLREDNDLKIALSVSSVFANGETMIRHELIKKHKLKYHGSKIPCEDYRFWVEIAEYTKFRVLPELLYIYRIHANSFSSTRWDFMQREVKKTSQEYSQKHFIKLLKNESIFSFYNRARNTKDNIMSCAGNSFNSFERLSYQIYLFRLAKKIIKEDIFFAVQLFIVSFLLSPQNWLRKVLKKFPDNSRYYVGTSRLN